MTRTQAARLYVSPGFIADVLHQLFQWQSYAPLTRGERVDAAVIYHDVTGTPEIAARKIFDARRAARATKVATKEPV